MADFQYAEQEQIRLQQQFDEFRKQLPGYVSEYLKDVRRKRQIRTTIAYTRELIDFFNYLKEANPLYKEVSVVDIPLSDISRLTYQDIDDYQDYLELPRGDNKHRKGPAAINRSISALSGFFKYMTIHEFIPKDPTQGATRGRKAPKKPIDKLEQHEVKALLDGVERSESGSDRSRAFTTRSQLRDTAIVTLLLGTGIRISECVGLDVNHVNLENQTIQVVRKGGDIERVYFNDDVKTALVDYISIERKADPKEGPLFLSNRNGRLTVRSIQTLLQKYGRANLPNHNLHPHTLRKTFGTNLYNQTGDIYLVADTLGHKNVAVTQQYYAAMSEEHKAQNKDLHLYDEGKKT